MVEVGNNIKVLFTKYNKDVIVDTIGGELILYNHSDLCDTNDTTVSHLLQDHIFTGIRLGPLSDSINMLVEDLQGNMLEHTQFQDFLYVKKYSNMDLVSPVSVVRFVPKPWQWAGDAFFAHFLEKKR